MSRKLWLLLTRLERMMRRLRLRLLLQWLFYSNWVSFSLLKKIK